MKKLANALGYLFLFFILPAAATEADTDEWPQYVDSINHNWPTFRYPPGYTVDPRSFGGPDHKDEGTLHLCILTSEKSALEIRASNYGFISDAGQHNGFESPRDLLLATLSGNEHTLRRVNKPDYEIFYNIQPAGVTVYFLKKNPNWGLCYNWLYFAFPKDKYEEHEATIKKIVNSFVPSFVNSKPSKGGSH